MEVRYLCHKLLLLSTLNYLPMSLKYKNHIIILSYYDGKLLNYF